MHTGSPPPTRGAPLARVTEHQVVGITPAYAGSTSRSSWACPSWTDHPRLRGEHRAGRRGVAGSRGSPPPTRGAPRSARPPPAPGPDHPRLRGEHFQNPSMICVPAGSPPPTRGARGSDGEAAAHRGITPAYAGSTTIWAVPAVARRDHPRLRGEHIKAAATVDQLMGSPPPTRGALGGWRGCGCARRITPAYAGSTTWAAGLSGATPDHPRLRGEHAAAAAAGILVSGSPPPTRGALYGIPLFRDTLGITPAYAGSTSSPSSERSPQEDHPRLRGEHRCPASTSGTLGGSPPPTRGALTRSRESWSLTGITPAYAGSTSGGCR